MKEFGMLAATVSGKDETASRIAATFASSRAARRDFNGARVTLGRSALASESSDDERLATSFRDRSTGETEEASIEAVGMPTTKPAAKAQTPVKNNPKRKTE